MDDPTLRRPPSNDQPTFDRNAPTEEYSKQQISLLLRAHESCTSELRGQLDEYRHAHSGLRTQLDRLAGDTQRLVAAATNEVESPRQQRNLIENLRSRLEISAQERETAMDLWRLAQTELSAVELELRACTNGSHVQQVRQECAVAVTALEHRLTSLAAEHESQRIKAAQLATELSAAREQLAAVREHVRQRDEELRAGLDATKCAGATIQELEAAVVRQQTALASARSHSATLETALAACRAKAQRWERRDAEAHDKLAEALALTEAALADRDAALAVKDAATEEASRLSSALAELVNEAGVAVHAEVARVTREHAHKMAAIVRELHEAQQREAASTAALSAERARIASEAAAAEPMERKLQAAYRELTGTERQLAGLRHEMHRLQRSAIRLQEELHAATSMPKLCAEGCEAERTELRAQLVDTTTRTAELHGHLEEQRDLQQRWSAATQAMTASFESRLRYLHEKLRAEKKHRAKCKQAVQRNAAHSDDQSRHS